jgi:transcriptional regulator with GAF, ATPase, and Fis domain
MAITTIGLAVSIPPLLSGRSFNPWPWEKTDFVLILGLSITVLSMIGYLTIQQRNVLNIHKTLRRIQKTTEDNMQRHICRLYALIKLSRKMASEIDLTTVFYSITEMCVEAFNCDRSSLMVYEEKDKELVVRAISGKSKGDVIETRQCIGEGVAGYAAELKKSLLLNPELDLSLYPGLELNDDEIHSAMVVPIILRNELVGVINVSSYTSGNTYTEEDLGALQVVAESVGAYIRHAEQGHWMRQTIEKLTSGKKKGSASTKAVTADELIG